jgi:hypothetical protein
MNTSAAIPDPLATTDLRLAGSRLGLSPHCTSTHRVLRVPRVGLATRLSDFATNRHEECGLVALFVDWSKRVSVLRHTLPKLKSLPICADSVDDAVVHIRIEMATWCLFINRLNAEINHVFEFTPLCF